MVAQPALAVDDRALLGDHGGALLGTIRRGAGLAQQLKPAAVHDRVLALD